MAIYYRTITTNTVEPTVKKLGDIWVKPLFSVTYQAYIYLGSWIELVGGGNFITETDADTHYINVIIQENVPTGIAQLGWIWIKESILQAYMYIGGIYVPIA